MMKYLNFISIVEESTELKEFKDSVVVQLLLVTLEGSVVLVFWEYK